MVLATNIAVAVLLMESITRYFRSSANFMVVVPLILESQPLAGRSLVFFRFSFRMWFLDGAKPIKQGVSSRIFANIFEHFSDFYHHFFLQNGIYEVWYILIFIIL